jgi:hypothetical protein
VILATWVLAATTGALAQQEEPVTSEIPPALLEAWDKAAAVGEHHAHLARLEGRWFAASRVFPGPGAEPIESRGWSTNQWILDGRFLQQDFAAELGSKRKFTGLGFLGYDNASGKHIAIWMESLSTGATRYEGTCSDDGKTIEFTSPKSRGVLKIKSFSTYTWEGFSRGPDGKEFKSIEIVYRKREGQ